MTATHHLRSLSLRIAYRLPASSDRHELISGVMRFVSSALNLSKLSIGFQDKYPTEYPYITLSTIVANNTWSSLDTLVLCGFEMTDTELIGLLRRHADRLRFLGIEYTMLKRGSWNNIVRFMRTRLHLTQSCFGKLYTANDRPYDEDEGFYLEWKKAPNPKQVEEMPDYVE